jgi:hypothetical protein
MAQTYTSEPLVRPRRTDSGYWRVDLIVDDVDHAGPSYEGRVFLDHPDAEEATPRQVDAGYAGSFHVFGHAGCFGDRGHCDVPAGPADPYDLRPTHQLVPTTKIVTVTDAVDRLGGDEVTVTIVAVVRPFGALPVGGDVERPLRFSSLRLVSYE